MDNKGLLYSNKYIPTEVFKGSKDVIQQDQFKNFYLEKKKINQRKRLESFLENKPKPDYLGSIPQHLLVNKDYENKKFLNNDLMSTNQIDFQTSTDEMDLTDSNARESEEHRYVQPIRTLIHIDSRDRDLTLYPKPNHYKMFLNHTFTNVKRISLRSTEFPNSVQLIKSTPLQQANNNIFWQDEGDSTIYSATLTSGNYQPSSLATEITNQMNVIPKINGKPHNFTVIIDQVTDTVTFSSFDIIGANNVLGISTAQQGIITVTLPTPHGFKTGDTIIISNGTAFSNIPSSEINGSKKITIIGLVNSTSFTYPISDTIIILETLTAQGGNIEFAKGSNFKLLFDAKNFPNTPSDILGFKSEDTIFSSEHKNTTISEAFAIKDIYSLNSTFTAIIVTKPHGITQGNEVRFKNINEYSDEINDLFSEGIGYKILPLTTDDLIVLQSFNFNPSLANNGFKAAIGTISNQSYATNITVTNSVILNNEFTCVKINKLYPIIIGLYPYTIGFNSFLAIEMDGIHGFEDGQIISISDVPELGNTTFTVSALSQNDIDELKSISDPDYDIFDTTTSFVNFFKIGVTSGVIFSKYYRNIPLQYFDFIEFPNDFSGVVEIGLKNKSVNTYLNLNNFVHVDEGFESALLTADDLLTLQSLKTNSINLDIDVNFKVKTNVPIQKGSLGSLGNGQFTFIRTINKPIVLSGENFMFMTSPNIDDLANSGAIKNTGIVSNIFAKITLSAPPGSVIFNSYISNAIIFENSPLPQLSEVEYSFRDKNNELFEFNDTDHSYTLEILEYRDKLRHNDYDSRRGRYDNVRLRQDVYS